MDPARSRLLVLSLLAGVATVTGVFMYAYPTTLVEARPAMALVHDVSGDLMVLAGIAYLIEHLSRTWRMRRKLVSRWTGLVAAGIWAAAALSGAYGQLDAMPSGSSVWSAHVLSSLALIVLACFHGAWGFLRARSRAEVSETS